MLELRYTFTAAIVRDLMAIEAARQAVRLTILPPQVMERLRQTARLRSTHYSTSARKSRRYRLSAEYRQFVGGLTAEST